MNNKHSSHPLICIDFKKNRIRIHRNTLRQIGNPEYIQLLVNPEQKMIGIKASCAEDKLAHKVKDFLSSMVTVMNCTAENYYIHFPSLTFLGRNLTFFV